MSKENIAGEVKKTAEKKKNIQNTEESVMYVGPSIVNMVQTSTVFKDGKLPEVLQKLLEDEPYMKKLFVPLSSLTEAIKELGREKSALSVIYTKVEKK